MRENAALPWLIVSLLFLAACQSPASPTAGAALRTDRERDGLSGPVRAMLTEDAMLPDPNSAVEGQLASSVSLYDESGKRTLQTPYQITLPTGRAITQHQAFCNPEKASAAPVVEQAGNLRIEYDPHGNIVRQQSSQPPSDISIRYDYDSRGNWLRRTITQRGDAGSPPRMETSYRYLVYFQSPEPPPTASPAPAAARANAIAPGGYDERAAQTLFRQRCAVCHGDEGKGKTELAAALTPPPAELSDPARAIPADAVLARLQEAAAPGRVHALGGRVPEDRLRGLAFYVSQLSRGTPSATRSEQLAQAAPAAKPAAEQRYPLKGKVLSIDLALKQVVVEHEAIPGYMEGMTMPFPLLNEAVLRRLKQGDRIEATLVVGIGFWRLENVSVK